MALKQTRRSISINRALYEQAKEVAADRGLPLAQLTEGAVKDAIGGVTVKQLTILRARVESLASSEGLPDVVFKYLRMALDEVDEIGRAGGLPVAADTLGHAQAPDDSATAAVPS